MSDTVKYFVAMGPARLMIITLVLIYTNVVQSVLDELFHKACKGQCGQGEGDCDHDWDCLPGLICDYDWWFDKDYCKAGTFKTIIWFRLSNIL